MFVCVCVCVCVRDRLSWAQIPMHCELCDCFSENGDTSVLLVCGCLFKGSVGEQQAVNVDSGGLKPVAKAIHLRLSSYSCLEHFGFSVTSRQGWNGNHILFEDIAATNTDFMCQKPHMLIYIRSFLSKR